MGKISNTIQMLNYLNTGNKYTVKELSEKIGITERMVRYYKVELEQAGISIETFMGPNGGYYILNTKNQYNHFNKYDLQLLENINMVLEKLGYEDIGKYKKLINKIKFASDVEEEKSKYFLDNGTSDKSELYFSLNDAISNKIPLKILYKNLKQEWQERIIHPLQIFNYDKRFYVTAFCELRNDIRHFEINRIKLNSE
ncbi:Transcriptional regulator, DeoR [human gut metagenome]|uniref:Transcriptional regulator, DeoR n=1 Tax=human gut metagenome TaxID=408170 RepID=K1TQL9_9ZZZZ